MANTIGDGTTRQHWMPRVQRELDKTLVSLPISDVYRGAERVIHNPYASTPVASDGAAATTYTVADYQVTDDTLTVSRRAVAAEHVDNIEELQQRFDLAMQRAERQAYTIADAIDQYVLNLPVSLAGITDLDDSNLGTGTSGNPFVTSNTNIDDVANKVVEQIGLNNGAMQKGMFWVVSPYEITDMTSFKQNNGFATSDAAIQMGSNGFVGELFSGLKVFKSNNLTHACTLALATNPTDGDTITINGVVFTFEDTLSVAGGLHIGSTVDDTRANMAVALNAPGTAIAEAATTGYQVISVADQAIINRLQLSATDSAAADTLAVTTTGTLIVSETLTDGTDAWGTVGRHTIAGVMGSIQLALPSDGLEFEKKAVTLKHGREVVTSQIYNATVWNNMLPEVYDVFLG